MSDSPHCAQCHKTLPGEGAIYARAREAGWARSNRKGLDRFRCPECRRSTANLPLRFTVTLPRELWVEMAVEAEAQGVAVAEIIRRRCTA
jgi:hypothetical protein